MLRRIFPDPADLLLVRACILIGIVLPLILFAS